MHPSPSSDPTHSTRHPLEVGPTPPRRNRVSVLLVRGLLYSFAHLGGAATGSAFVALLTVHPTDWRWVWLGVGGLLMALCAVFLIPYLPGEPRDAP